MKQLCGTVHLAWLLRLHVHSWGIGDVQGAETVGHVWSSTGAHQMPIAVPVCETERIVKMSSPITTMKDAHA
jgi:hypothetical protein